MADPDAKFVHWGVTCDFCQGVVVGARYKYVRNDPRTAAEKLIFGVFLMHQKHCGKCRNRHHHTLARYIYTICFCSAWIKGAVLPICIRNLTQLIVACQFLRLCAYGIDSAWVAGARPAMTTTCAKSARRIPPACTSSSTPCGSSTTSMQSCGHFVCFGKKIQTPYPCVKCNNICGAVVILYMLCRNKYLRSFCAVLVREKHKR
jgi:hypothetical protein